MATICNHHVISCMHGLRERKLPQQQALERAGINPAVMGQPNQRVHTDQVARLFKTVQETLDDEFMGFTYNNCKVGLFATMAELVSHCSQVGKPMETLATARALHPYSGYWTSCSHIILGSHHINNNSARVFD